MYSCRELNCSVEHVHLYDRIHTYAHIGSLIIEHDCTGNITNTSTVTVSVSCERVYGCSVQLSFSSSADYM